MGVTKGIGKKGWGTTLRMKLNGQSDSLGRKEDTDDPEILSQGGKNGNSDK